MIAGFLFTNVLIMLTKERKVTISPRNIDALHNRVVMRITHMITQDEFPWYFINLQVVRTNLF